MQELLEWFINFTEETRSIKWFLVIFFPLLSFLFLLINKGEDESLFDVLKKTRFFSDDNTEIDRKTFQNNQREKFRKRRNKR
jgi:hypothetical protein